MNYNTFNVLLLLGLRMEIRYWVRKIIVNCDDLQILAVHWCFQHEPQQIVYQLQ